MTVFSLTRRVVLAGACVASTPGVGLAQNLDWTRLPRGRQSPQPAPGQPFQAQYLVDFWERAPAGTVLPEDSPSRRAPAFVQPEFSQLPTYGSRKPNAAQLALFRRRFDLVRGTLLAQPSLSDMRGSGINMQCRIESFAEGAGPDGGRMSVEMGLSFRDINLDDPKTFQLDGRYYTPGEGSTLQINVNNTRDVRDGRLAHAFAQGPNTLFYARRSLHGVYWVNPALGPLPPAVVDGVPQENLSIIPRGGDPTDIHLLTAAWTGGYSNSDVLQGEASPTSSKGRALAALYMVDWPELIGRMQSL